MHMAFDQPWNKDMKTKKSPWDASGIFKHLDGGDLQIETLNERPHFLLLIFEKPIFKLYFDHSVQWEPTNFEPSSHKIYN